MNLRCSIMMPVTGPHDWLSSVSFFTSHFTQVPSGCYEIPNSYLAVWSPAYSYSLLSTNILVLSSVSQEYRTDDLFGVGFFYKELILFHNGFYSFHTQRRYLSPNSELLNLSWLYSHSRVSCFMEGCDSINFSFFKISFFIKKKTYLVFCKKILLFF